MDLILPISRYHLLNIMVPSPTGVNLTSNQKKTWKALAK